MFGTWNSCPLVVAVLQVDHQPRTGHPDEIGDGLDAIDAAGVLRETHRAIDLPFEMYRQRGSDLDLFLTGEELAFERAGYLDLSDLRSRGLPSGPSGRCPRGLGRRFGRDLRRRCLLERNPRPW